MTDRCAVSVVIPAFNSARWIEETLSSVAAQTIGMDKLEAIVVDDGSTDNTAEIAERWLAKVPLAHRIIRQSNQGPSHARNVGWQAARAPWIQFLDADDLLDREKIEIQWNVCSGCGEETAMVYSPWRKFGLINLVVEHGETVDTHLGSNVVTDYLDQTTGGAGIATGSQLYNRSWLERIGGWYGSYRYGEDHELNLRLAFAGAQFVHAGSDRPLFFYRRHGPSLSTLSGRTNAEAVLRIVKYVEEESLRRGQLNQKRAAEIAKMYASSVRGIAAYDWSAARDWIGHLFELDPNYQPHWSARFRILSALIGFRRAVWVAAWVRRKLPARVNRPRLVSIGGPVVRLPESPMQKLPLE